MIDVFAADEQRDAPVPIEALVELTRAVLADRGLRGGTEVSLLFVDEGTIAALNERFLQHEGPTDVLSFPVEDELETSGRFPDSGGTGPGTRPKPELPLLLGDVVICPAVAARQAVEHGVAIEDELALLVVHGTLHLLGMDHEKDDEADRMERLEQDLLDRYHRGRPTKVEDRADK